MCSVKISFVSLFSLLLLVLQPTEASAKTEKITVQSGAIEEVANLGIFRGKSCEPATAPSVTVVKQPKKGKLIVKNSSVVIRNGHKCAGAKLKTKSIKYKANNGYRGRDSFTIDVKFLKNESRSETRAKRYKYKINVR